MRNPYFNKNHPKTWKERLADFFYLLAIPFIWIGIWGLKFLNFPKNCKWLYSLFTDVPIPISKYTMWFYVRGKKKSLYEILSKEWRSYSSAMNSRKGQDTTTLDKT
jgi:hypothetical protein